MEDNTQDIVFLELRQKLQSGLLFIRIDASDVRIEYRQGSILSIHIPDRIYQVNLTPGVSIVDASCQKSPGSTKQESYFRLRVRLDQQLEDPSSVIGQLKIKEIYCFLCQSCGSRVLQNRIFKRVLPLPNGNWNALVDDWCCHPDPFANRKLLPRDGDCLLGDTYILLARDSSCEETLTQHVNPFHKETAEQKHSCKSVLVSCRNCSTALGEEITSGVLKFYITEIIIKPSEDGKCDVTQHSLVSTLTRCQFLEQTLTARLVELSSAQSIFRFSIQNPDGKAMILLWLLNTDTLVASFSGGAVNFHSAGEVLQTCQAVRAVKVLFLPCSDSMNKDVVDVWEKDISVHPLPLPQRSCEELHQLLTFSNLRLPFLLRCMNAYQVAYMRM